MAEIVPTSGLNNQSQPVIDLHGSTSKKLKVALKKRQSEANPRQVQGVGEDSALPRC